MRYLASSLLLGAASAAISPQQHVLRPFRQMSEVWNKPLQNLQDSFKSFTGEARNIWDEVAMMFPEDMDRASFIAPPKKHTRKPDGDWDHIMRGQDVQSIWIKNHNGEQEREVDGKLEAYNLRTKIVDPSSLGVDPEVKQYSGYLDDEENDKHLFYCEKHLHRNSR